MIMPWKRGWLKEIILSKLLVGLQNLFYFWSEEAFNYKFRCKSGVIRQSKRGLGFPKLVSVCVHSILYAFYPELITLP